MICMVLLSATVVFAAEAPQKLPNIKILATGGTIAGSAGFKHADDRIYGRRYCIQVLMDAVPQMKDYANVSGRTSL